MAKVSVEIDLDTLAMGRKDLWAEMLTDAKRELEESKNFAESGVPPAKLSVVFWTKVIDWLQRYP